MSLGVVRDNMFHFLKYHKIEARHAMFPEDDRMFMLLHGKIAHDKVERFAVQFWSEANPATFTCFFNYGERFPSVRDADALVLACLWYDWKLFRQCNSLEEFRAEMCVDTIPLTTKEKKELWTLITDQNERLEIFMRANNVYDEFFLTDWEENYPSYEDEEEE